MTFHFTIKPQITKHIYPQAQNYDQEEPFFNATLEIFTGENLCMIIVRVGQFSF